MSHKRNPHIGSSRHSGPHRQRNLPLRDAHQTGNLTTDANAQAELLEDEFDRHGEH